MACEPLASGSQAGLAPGHILGRIGFWSSLAYAFLAFLSVAGTHLAYALLAAAALLDTGFRRWALNDAAVRVLLLLAAWVLFASLWGGWLLPGTADAHWREAKKWWLLLGVLPLAWWVRGDPRVVGLMVCAAALGWLGAGLMKADWQSVFTYGLAARTGLGHKIIFNGTLGAIVLVGCMLLAPRWAAAWPGRRVFALGLLLAVVAYALLAVMLSQSRGVWLALWLVLPLATWAQHAGMRQEMGWKAAWPGVAKAVVMAVAVGILAQVSLTQRDVQWQREVTPSARETAPTSSEMSLGYRYDLLLFGLEKWSQRPFLGWGTGAPALLVADSRRPELAELRADGLHWFDHLHNTPLEVMVRFGLVGVVLFALAGGVWLARLAGAARRNPGRRDLVLFFQAGITLYLLASLTDFRVLSNDSRSLLILLSGLALGLTLEPARARRPAA